MPGTTRDAVAGADLVPAIGTRLNQQTTAGWTLPHPDQRLIQIDPAEEVIGQNHRPTIGMVSDIKLALACRLSIRRYNPARQGGSTNIARYSKWATPPERPTSKVSMEKVMLDMRRRSPRTPIHGGCRELRCGSTSTRFSVPDTFFGPTVGCMGYGVPLRAIGAKLAHPIGWPSPTVAMAAS